MMHHKNTSQLRMIKSPTIAPSQPGWMEGGSADRRLSWNVSLTT